MALRTMIAAAAPGFPHRVGRRSLALVLAIFEAAGLGDENRGAGVKG